MISSFFDGEATKSQRLSYAEIAKAASLSERTVGRTVPELEAFGFLRLKKTRASRDARGRTVRGHFPHVYDIQIPDTTWTEIPRQSVAAKTSDVAILSADVDTVSTSTWTQSPNDVDTVAGQLERPTRNTLENLPRLRSSNGAHTRVANPTLVDRYAHSLRDTDWPTASARLDELDETVEQSLLSPEQRKARVAALFRIWLERAGVTPSELTQLAA
jgi:DNA-binding Lrp family transcriptional regulator